MVTGQRPFSGDQGQGTTPQERLTDAHLHPAVADPCELNPALPRAAAEVVMRALAVEPAERWPDVTKMIDAWEGALGLDHIDMVEGTTFVGRTLAAQTPKPSTQLLTVRVAAPRRPWLAIAAAAVLVVVAAEAFVLLGPLRSSRPVPGSPSVPTEAAAAVRAATLAAQPTYAAALEDTATVQASAADAVNQAVSVAATDGVLAGQATAQAGQVRALGMQAADAAATATQQAEVVEVQSTVGAATATQQAAALATQTAAAVGATATQQGAAVAATQTSAAGLAASQQAVALATQTAAAIGATATQQAAAAAATQTIAAGMAASRQAVVGATQTAAAAASATQQAADAAVQAALAASTAAQEGANAQLPVTATVPTQTPTAPAPAAAPVSGHIVYDQADGGSSDVMAVDVASKQSVTVYANAWQPNVCSNSQVIFHAKAGDKGDLFSIYLNGSGESQISNHTEDNSPHWSSDCQRIVFDADYGGSGHPTTLFTLPGSARQEEGNGLMGPGQQVQGNYPVWLDDGRIAYVGCEGQWNAPGKCGILAVDVSGNYASQPVALTTAPNDRPCSSANGHLLYQSQSTGNWQVFSVAEGGGTGLNLTNSSNNDFGPTFSPDGDTIAFASDRGGNWGIWLMNSDGSNVRQLISCPRALGRMIRASASLGRRDQSLALRCDVFRETGKDALATSAKTPQGESVATTANETLSAPWGD